MKKILSVIIGLFLALPVMADDVWVNDLRNLFLSNRAIIYGINLRTFGAQDTNMDGIIDEGEESGNFLNAIEGLDDLQALGINTLHLLPVMETGKIHAFGTAGSLYAAKSFNKLNPQLKSRRSMLTVEEQAIKFINEAHKRGMRIIMDIPACASYDLYQERPELFVKDFSGKPVSPLDWKDVYALNGGTESNVNRDVYELYKSFVDYVMLLGADGIRADVAQSKPAALWKELIQYSRTKDPQFMWLAESSEYWHGSIGPRIVDTPYNKLLEAGFDGFYAGYFGMKEWKSAKQLMSEVKFTNSLSTKFSEPKSVIGSFATHDEMSPVLVNGMMYSNMILWLNSTLKLNSYFVDGFPTGDKYIYFYGNKAARSSQTDSNTYFVHRGKLDIFNFSRKPGGPYIPFKRDFAMANHFKSSLSKLINTGKYTQLKTTNDKVFAYGISADNSTLLVFGNMDFKQAVEAEVKVNNFKQQMMTIPIKINSIPKSQDGKFILNLNPGEINVLIVADFEL